MLTVTLSDIYYLFVINNKNFRNYCQSLKYEVTFACHPVMLLLTAQRALARKHGGQTFSPL